jgi:signal transduction histidine kinase/DNA-binding response OmpR family regulator
MMPATAFRRFAVITILLLLAYGALIANTDYYFKQVSIEQGLSQSSALCATTDSRGYLWIGTRTGLNRYDQSGVRQYIHNPGDTLSLPQGRILFVVEDLNQTLWVATEQQLARFDRTREQFVPERCDGSAVRVGGYLVQSESILFCGSDALYTYYYGNKQMRRRQLPVGKPGVALFNAIIRLKDDRYLLSSRWSGLWEYNPQASTLRQSTVYADKDIMAIAADSHGRIWISPYGRGVRCYTPSGRLVAEYTSANSRLSNDIVLCIAQRGNDIWLGTDGGGINILSLDNDSITHLKPEPGNGHSFPANSVISLYRDAQQNMWAGSIRDGLIGIKEVYVKTYRDAPLGSPYGTSDKTILSLCTDKTYLWIGTDGGGVNRHSIDDESFRHYPSTYGLKVVSLVELSDSELLISAFGKGLYRLNKSTGALAPFTFVNERENEQIRRSNVSVNIARISPTEYIFTAHSIYHYDAERNSFSLIKVKSADHLQVSSGLIYIASNQSESYFFGSNRIVRVDHADKTYTSVFSLAPRFGTLNCVALSGETFQLGTSTGLYNLTLGGEPQRINTPLFHEVNALLTTRNGNLLIASRGVICRLSPDGRFSVLDESDGLKPNEFLPKPVIVGPSGDNFLGGVSGLVRVKASAPPVSYGGSPVVSIVETALNGKSIEPKQTGGVAELTVPHNYNSLTVRIAAYQEEVFRRKLYRYYIDGGNSNPVETTDNLIKLHNLAPGEYTLVAQSALPDGTWNEPCRLLKIRVSDPWWATPLSKAFAVILLLIGVWLAVFLPFRRKERRLARDMEEHERRVQEEKVRFLISINHELRTPLTLIHAPLRQLIDKTTLPLDAKRQLQRIYKQTKHMCNTVNMVLDLRRIETTDNPLHLAPTDINRWVRAVSADFEYELAERPDRLHLALADELPVVTFDANRCESVLATILINSFRFCGPDSVITVSTAQVDDYVRIAVSTTDLMLGEGDAEMIFKRFYLGSTTDKQSAGIGLSYAKVLIELHGGRVGAFNNNDATGATIYFDLPLNLPSSIGQTSLEGVMSPTEVDDSLPAETAEAETTSSGHTLLIAESDPDLRRLLVEILAEKFAAILEADNGVDAFRLVRQEVPDVVIAAVNLPRDNGLQLCTRIKQTPELAHIPVVLLSGKTDQEDYLRCYKAGADIHLAKPFEPAILEARVINLLKNNANMKKRYKKFDVGAELSEQDTMSGADEQFVVRLNQAIQDNLDNSELDVAFIAKTLGLSRATLYGKMRSLIGMGVGDYIARHRLDAACILLEQTALPIQEVSARCGFSNQRYFSTVFKQAKGMTPTAWREARRPSATRQ